MLHARALDGWPLLKVATDAASTCPKLLVSRDLPDNSALLHARGPGLQHGRMRWFRHFFAPSCPAFLGGQAGVCNAEFMHGYEEGLSLTREMSFAYIISVLGITEMRQFKEPTLRGAFFWQVSEKTDFADVSVRRRLAASVLLSACVSPAQLRMC